MPELSLQLDKDNVKMDKPLYNCSHRIQNCILQSTFLLLVCFSFIAGSAQDVQATLSNTTTTPVLESAEVVGSDVVLTWSQPETVYGAPRGGYDTFIDGVDQNNHLSGLSTTIKGLAPGEHTFQVEARYLQTREFNRSNVVSVIVPENSPFVPEEPVVSKSTTTPVLESAEVIGSDVILTWSQPASVYGAPDGGYDTFIDGIDQNDHLRGLSTTLSGLAPGQHTFQIEARYTESRPKEFNHSKVLTVTLKDSTPTVPEGPSQPEEPAISDSTTTPVLESVQVNGNDFVLTWSQPPSIHGAPDGGYDIFIDGVDQNNHLGEFSTTVSGLPPGVHTFQVEARYTETRPKNFNRSNVVSAESKGSPPALPEEPTIPEEPTLPSQITLAWDQSTDAQVIGYRLYYKESSAGDPSYNLPPFDSTGLGDSPIDIGLNETYTLNLPYDTTVYCFAVKAYNSDRLESDFSNVVCTQ